MADSNKSRFAKIVFIFLVVSIFIAGLIFSISIILFSKDFFLKYSPDGMIKPETIDKINTLRITVGILGIASFLTILVLFSIRSKVEIFLEKRKNILANLFLFFSVLIIILVVGEISLRILIYDETSGQGASPGSLKFNERHVSLNSEGFRDFEYTLIKPDNTVRIAVIGDSFTFGMGVRNVSNIYPKVLEKNINDLDLSKKFEVLAFGIPGYDTEQHIDTIKKHALKYSPNIIVIGYVLNDLPNPAKVDVKYQKIELPFIGFWLRSSSYLYYFIESRINEFVKSNSEDYNYENVLNRLYNSSANLNKSKEIYKKIASISKENNISVILVTFPIIHNLQDYKFMSAHEHAGQITSENNFLGIDLLADYQKYNDGELVVNKYDGHPNELGHKIAADAILKKLQKHGLLY